MDNVFGIMGWWMLVAVLLFLSLQMEIVESK